MQLTRENLNDTLDYLARENQVRLRIRHGWYRGPDPERQHVERARELLGGVRLRQDAGSIVMPAVTPENPNPLCTRNCHKRGTSACPMNPACNE